MRPVCLSTASFIETCMSQKKKIGHQQVCNYWRCRRSRCRCFPRQRSRPALDRRVLAALPSETLSAFTAKRYGPRASPTGCRRSARTTSPMPIRAPPEATPTMAMAAGAGLGLLPPLPPVPGGATAGCRRWGDRVWSVTSKATLRAGGLGRVRNTRPGSTITRGAPRRRRP